DEVAQVSVVALHRRLPGPDRLPLGEERAELPWDAIGLLRRIEAWVLRYVDADHADASGGPHDVHQRVESHFRMLLAGLIVRLPAHRLHPAVGPLPACLVQDL